jgi:hypothetical protein
VVAADRDGLSRARYLDAAGHGTDEPGALFRPIRNNRTGRLERAITPDGIYKLVRAYSAELEFEIGAHALRATAATNGSIMRRTLPRCKNGSVTRTSPRPRSTITAARGRASGIMLSRRRVATLGCWPIFQLSDRAVQPLREKAVVAASAPGVDNIQHLRRRAAERERVDIGFYTYPELTPCSSP